MKVFRVVLEMHVAAGDADRFERVWVDAATSFLGTPGILGQTLAADVIDRGHFTVTSDWTDEEHFHRFEVSSRQDAATAALRALRISSTMKAQFVRAVVVDPDNLHDNMKVLT